MGCDGGGYPIYTPFFRKVFNDHSDNYLTGSYLEKVYVGVYTLTRPFFRDSQVGNYKEPL